MVFFLESVFDEIKKTIGFFPPERGGILGSNDGETVVRFYYDKSASTTCDSYSPDCEKINRILENEWADEGIYMIGVVHSHDSSCNFPSCGDIVYAEKIMRSAQMDRFVLPIVCTDPFSINMYVVHLIDGKISVEKEDIKII